MAVTVQSMCPGTFVLHQPVLGKSSVAPQSKTAMEPKIYLGKQLYFFINSNNIIQYTITNTYKCNICCALCYSGLCMIAFNIQIPTNIIYAVHSAIQASARWHILIFFSNFCHILPIIQSDQT